MATQADINWVLQRLPAGVSFNKNGVVQTPSEMATAALDEHASDTNPKIRSLVDLLQILLSDIKYQSETMGKYSYTRPTLVSLLGYWTDELQSLESGGLTQIPVTYESSVCDEFSRAT